ncbi:M20/M25/M40 family metallo-hydrolase [Streptomyces ficellus]|uniref:M20/M25/M40 family metallo-hydrolase n=1 Tax=Streptomyces ficellus TaxID=1977088 RepID=A0A1W5T537_9ACTN|nr:M20/M25/M40 family metallo-hydrolase [Streptomyces ficellus]ARF06200.1 peptidase [Streptomyces ficellus]QGV77854.1 M20/M25/M40 family metallo-hydrolase [Streptomyces ficellus]
MWEADARLRRAVHDGRPGMLEALAGWVGVPSVSAVPGHRPDVVRSARWLASALRSTGFPVVEVWETDGLPAVYAHWPAEDAGAPTLLVYSHHDVHAVKDGEWRETSPFSPVVREGRMYGRGASDAKGQTLCHLWALRAHMAAGRRAPAVGVTLLVEGEEEIGSVHLADLLAAHREQLAADVVMVSDTMLWSLTDAAVCTGVRGSVNGRLEVRGADADVHSGAVAGTAPNACTELCRLLGLLHDEKGRVTLPGFYDAVAPLSRRERAELDALPFDEAAWLADSHTRSVRGEHGRSVLERIWTRPSVEVSSLLGGDAEQPSRGVIPPTARADLLLRLVPEQTADEVARQLRRWLEDHRVAGYDYELTVSSTISDPYLTPTGHPAAVALEGAMSRALGRPPLRMRNGGAAPAAQLARETGAPVVFFGTGLVDDRWHGHDEKVEIRALLQGAETLAYFLEDLASAMGRPGRVS